MNLFGTGKKKVIKMDYNTEILQLKEKRAELEAELVKVTADLLGAEKGSEDQKYLRHCRISASKSSPSTARSPDGSLRRHQ